MKPIFTFIVALLIAFVFLQASHAQDLRTITGIVTSFNKIPLNKVRVSAEKSGETVFTSSDGQFSINVAGKDQLTVSAAGFYNKKIKVGNDKIYKIEMIFINKESNIEKAVNEGHIAEKVLRQALSGGATEQNKDYSKYKTIFELIGSEINNVRVKGNSVVNLKVRSFDSSPRFFMLLTTR